MCGVWCFEVMIISVSLKARLVLHSILSSNKRNGLLLSAKVGPSVACRIICFKICTLFCEAYGPLINIAIELYRQTVLSYSHNLNKIRINIIHLFPLGFSSGHILIDIAIQFFKYFLSPYTNYIRIRVYHLIAIIMLGRR
jgi:hypothetical protein